MSGFVYFRDAKIIPYVEKKRLFGDCPKLLRGITVFPLMIARFRGLEIGLLAERFTEIAAFRQFLGTFLRHGSPRLWRIYSSDCPNEFATSSYNRWESTGFASDWPTQFLVSSANIGNRSKVSSQRVQAATLGKRSTSGNNYEFSSQLWMVCMDYGQPKFNRLVRSTAQGAHR